MSKKPFSRREFFKRVAKTTLVGTCGVLGLYEYTFSIEPHWIDVTHNELPLPRLHPAFDGLRIVHLTDLHLSHGYMSIDHLQNIVAKTNALKPDLILMTGDFIDSYREPPFMKQAGALLGTLQAKEGTFAVLGNHDYWYDPTVTRAMLQQGGIQELQNRSHTLRRDDARLHIAGMDDVFPDRILSDAEQRGYVETILADLPSSDATILMVHEPDVADLTSQYQRFDLQVSGHAHGGQVRLPFKGAFVLPPLGQKYYAGRYDVGAMVQYTSRGLGMVEPAGRFLCRPEIALLTLRSAANLLKA